ncbi:MAG: extracellular solute-binding protein [Clostridia bacterium]|nr:extracellular solute-binding protein [Clostridia bacterium]
MRKILAVMLVLAMMTTVFVAASADDAKPEMITVTVFRGEPGEQPAADNRIYRKIEEELGIRFEIEFLTGDLDETLMQKLSGDTYPDLFDGSNSDAILEDAGVLIDLLPYISEEKTPNLYKHLYTDNRINQLVTDDGKLYIIPNHGITYNKRSMTYPKGPAFFLQKQVIAWDNYKVPTTLNEYFDLIERFIAANPETPEGTPYTGFAILCDDWHRFCLVNPVQHLMGRPNDGDVIVDVTTPEYKTETFINQPYAKAYYAKLNEAFNKGLIREETFHWNYDQYINKLSGGSVLGMFDQNWNMSSVNDALYMSVKFDQTFLAIPLVYDPEYVDGREIEEHYVNYDVMNKDRGFGISVTCPYPERLVAMMDTFLSDEWQLLFQWGIEGEDYYVDENGRMRMTLEQFLAQAADTEWKLANQAETIWEGCPKKEGTMDDGNAWAPMEQPEIYYDQMTDYDREFLAACGKKLPIDFFNLPLELAPYGEAWQIDKDPIDMDYMDFEQIEDQRLPEIIMCDPAELDSLWDDFVDEISHSASVYSEFMQEEILKLVEKTGK